MGLDATVAAVVGTAAYLGAPGARRAVRANLAVVAPDRTPRQREALVRQAFIDQVLNYIDIFRIPRMKAGEVLTLVHREGWENFTRAQAEGHGVIIASAHLGSVSLCGQIVVANGYEVTLPVETDNSMIGRAVNRARAGQGLHVISTESARGIFKVLKQGGTIGIIADRAVTGVGIRMPFFGREALVPTAHIVLALRTGATIVPAFARRERGERFATFEPPLQLTRSGDHDADVRDGMATWVAILESRIARAPQQWSVFERVWA